MKHNYAKNQYIKKGKKKIIIIISAIFLILIILFYGPYDYFRVLWINTAMGTSDHKWLATALFSQDYINKVINENFVTTDMKTDGREIKTGEKDNIDFAEIKGNYYKGYLIRISNPSRLSLISAGGSDGKRLEDIIFASGCSGGINASGYIDNDTMGIEWGFSISDGKEISKCDDNHDKHILGGMNRQNIFIVGSFTAQEIKNEDFKWAVEFGPILIANGVKTEVSEMSGGLSPRTAIGQTQKGEILLLAVDGRQVSSIGASYYDVQRILYENGAVNAIVLDGGASTSMVFEGTLVNSPSDGDDERLLPNAIVF